MGTSSGCQLNPAASVGLLVGKPFPASELVPYVIAQVLGGIAGAFADPWARQQLWLFWVAPIIGAAIGGIVYPLVAGKGD